jgi:hypothetical protein
LLCDGAAAAAQKHGVNAFEERVDDRLARCAHRALLRVAHCVQRVSDRRGLGLVHEHRVSFAAHSATIATIEAGDHDDGLRGQPCGIGCQCRATHAVCGRQAKLWVGRNPASVGRSYVLTI